MYENTTHGDMSPTHEQMDVFDDDFAVDDFDMVADGFRPGNDAGRQSEEDLEEEVEEGALSFEPPIRTVSAHYTDNPALTMIRSGPSRSSTHKSRSYDNPFASREDEQSQHNLERTSSMRSQSSQNYAPGIAGRTLSSSSSHIYAGHASPRFGSAGPSHPYGMYQQGTMPRSPSAGTSSTARPGGLRGSIGRDGPQHPYALYPQNVDVDEEPDDEELQDPIVPVGFPGLGGQSYHRYRGPDGEEQDIIGADGHAEQLPPYTRYPDDGKTPLLAVPEGLHSRQPVAGTDPGMPLMHQHLTAQSMTDESQMDSRASLLPTLNPVTTRSSTYTTASWKNKPWREKTWKQKRKTKFFGIPFWWILLAVCVLVFIAAVLGGVIGGFLSGAKHAHEQALEAKHTSLYDAKAIPTPTNQPPTGTYALTLGTPTNIQSACLTEPSQAAAWDCDLAGTPALAISVGDAPGSTESPGAYIYYASGNQEISYGTQYQFMDTNFATFQTVLDNEEPSNGPAFQFQQFFNKIVVVEESALNVTSSSSNSKDKRQWQSQWNHQNWWQQRKQVVNPGEQPWLCFWNNTLLEGFIYVQQPISSSTTSSTSLQSTISSPTPTSQTSSTTSQTTGSAQTGTTAVSPTSTTNTAVYTTTVTLSSTTMVVTGTGSPADYQQQNQYNPNNPNPNNGNPINDKPIAKLARQASYDLPDYPYVVKIEERRVQGNSVPPYCQKYQILNNMEYNWVAGADGQPIIIHLDESDPSYSAYESAGLAEKKRKRTADLVPGACHCEWTSGN